MALLNNGGFNAPLRVLEMEAVRRGCAEDVVLSRIRVRRVIGSVRSYCQRGDQRAALWGRARSYK